MNYHDEAAHHSSTSSPISSHSSHFFFWWKTPSSTFLRKRTTARLATPHPSFRCSYSHYRASFQKTERLACSVSHRLWFLVVWVVSCCSTTGWTFVVPTTRRFIPPSQRSSSPMSRTPEASVHREDPDPNRPSLPNNNNKFHFSIDRGGTFTDVYCRLPDGSVAVRKLLSEDPAHYPDAPTEGIRRLLEEFDDTTASSSSRSYARGAPIDCSAIGSIRMGTTVATNALLERQGARTALVCTTGFRDALYIGTQARPDIFDLTCARPSLLYESVVEVHERVVLEHFATHNELYQSHRRATGTTGEPVIVLQELNLVQVRTDLERLMKQGITSLAVCLLHAYLYPEDRKSVV